MTAQIQAFIERKQESLWEVNGDALRGVRMNRNLTLKQLAKKAKVSVSFLAHVEKGERLCSHETMKRILEALE